MDNLDWLNIYNQDLELEIHSIEQPDNFDFRDIPNEFKIDRMTLLTQFFIAQYALGKEKIITTIPIPDHSIYQRVLDCLALNFESVKGVFDPQRENSLPFEIQLTELADRSRQQINEMYYSNALNPIISGFYGDLHDPPHGVINQTLTCQVDSRMIPKLNTDEVEKFKEVWEFLRETYLRCYGCIDITPTYWWGTDQLKENIALRYLCTVSDRVFLFIDEPTKRVIGLNVLA